MIRPLFASLLLMSCSAAAHEPRMSGLASWYGPGFHGRQTACGETYNQHDLTAAHNRLPCGTIVRVTRTDTGAEVTVRINDRGPFERRGERWVPHSARVIDLSLAAAWRLDAVDTGVVPVRLEVVR